MLIRIEGELFYLTLESRLLCVQGEEDPYQPLSLLGAAGGQAFVGL